MTSNEIQHLVRTDLLAYECYKEMKEAMAVMPPCPDGDLERPCTSCLAEAAGVLMALRIKAERADAELQR